MKKYNSLDLFKFIFAFAVISIHTHPFEYINNLTVININELFVRLAVPFFFICSGFLLGQKIIGVKSNNEKSGIVLSSLKKFLKMYLIWTIVYAPLAFYSFFQNGYSITKACIVWLKNILFVGENYNSFHLWYLLSSVYTLFIIYKLSRRGIKKRNLYLLIAIASVVSVAMSIFASSNMQLGWVNSIVKYTVYNGRIFNGMVYIPIGILMAMASINYEKNIKIRMVSIVVFLVSMVARYYFGYNELLKYYLLIISSVSLVCIILNIKLKDKNMYKEIRKYSTIIFLIHMGVWAVYYKLIYGCKTFGLDSFIAVSVISLMSSVIWCKIQAKIANFKR